MLRSVGDLDEYKYVLNDIIISKKGSNDQLIIKSAFIKSITIVNKYDENIIPIIQVIASVTKDVYKALTIDEADLKALVIMYKNIVNTDVKARELVFNKSFSIRNEYDFQPEELRTMTGEKDNGDEIDANSPNALVDASFYLLDNMNITMYRKVKSLSVVDSLTNALAAAFASRGFTSILMNAIPYDKVSNIIVPTGNLLATLDYINKNNGLFVTPYTFYMGLTHNYMLDRINLGKAVEEDTPSNVAMFLEEDGSNEQSDVGCSKEGNAYIANMTEPPKIVKLDNYSELIDGSSIMSIDSLQTVTTFDGGDDALVKPVYVSSHKISRQLRHRSKEMKSALMVNLIDIDYEMIGPNLLYKVTAHKKFEELNPVNGDYRLSTSVINITKATDTDFSLTASLTLKKIVQDE
jgi:hypothetical protein